MKINGATVMIPTVYNPSEMRSDVTGKVVRFLQNDGDTVEKDQPYVEVEAMKMIMAIKATESGVINHNMSPGSIISAGDLIASLKLKDPSKVKQITKFSGRLDMIQIPPGMTMEDAKEALALSIDGYENNYNAALKVYLTGNKVEDIVKYFAELLGKFLAVEAQFDGQEEGAVVGQLAKTNKDSLTGIVPTLIAHRQVKMRSSCVQAILRELEFFSERFPGFSLSDIPGELSAALTGLSKLSNPIFGELNLKANQIMDIASMPPFKVRLEALKAELLKSSADLKALSKQPNLAVSVDLLTVLFSDSDVKVRKSAMEAYLRRVYRAQCIKTLTIDEDGGVLTATWTFTSRDNANDASERSGFMAMLPKFGDINSLMPGVLTKATGVLKKGQMVEPINVLHIGFSQFTGSEDDNAIIAEKVIQSYVPQITAMGVRSANLLLVNPGSKVTYFNYYAQQNFKEDLVSRNMRPTMPQLLEISRLAQNHNVIRMPTVNRNSFLFLGTEKTVGIKTKEPQQVVFLRSISNSDMTRYGYNHSITPYIFSQTINY